jgi:Tfp pilus assembly protein PilF
VTASVGQAGDYVADPRAAALVTQGRSMLEAGKTSDAIDAFEAALAVDPGYVDVYLDLAEAARRNGMQGKAIHYYRVAQKDQPENLAAISGEGEALAEKGAVEKAKRNLAKLETMCGDKCTETQALATAIQNVPPPKVVTAEAVAPDPVVTQN